tara:strand:+ start:1077 stop:1448 length:372 start_codon:yes stop_codon:yes gene_type:complete
MDKLDQMFKLRELFMETMKEAKPGIYPDWPVDIKQKENQQLLRDTALKGVEEMFEALGHLKNWKPHRNTEIEEFDRDEFLEEIVDAFNYFLSILVLTGVTSEELFATYVKKDDIIHKRLQTGY